MTAASPLNNVDHHDLHIRTDRRAELSDAQMSCVVFPDEFRQVQAHYPIFFQKDAQGGFQPVALFGLHEGQNLFLGPRAWDAHYLPWAVERLPFLIGRSEGEWVVHIDLDSPLVSRTEGEPVFLPHGGNTDFLERMTSLLMAIHDGMERLPHFIDALVAHRLLESFVLDVDSPEGSSRLAGLYTIHEERLASLEADALATLHHAGHLQAIYMAVASLSRVRDLIERQSRQGGGKA